MAKVKTHKGLAKVLKVRKGGTITFRSPGMNHNTGKKSAKQKNRNRSNLTLSKADSNRLERAIK